MEEIEATTGKTPQALLDRPAISDFTRELIDAFAVLAQTRSVGFSANPIQLSEIKAYIDLYGEPMYPVPVFIRLILYMDQAYLDLASKSNKEGKKVYHG